MLLATDLDGTFLAGNEDKRRQLYDLLRENPDIILVFVTGRGLETVIPLLNDSIIPNPHYIICDVGSTIVNGFTLKPVETIHEDMELGWPGDWKVRDCLEGIPDLEYQEVPQQRRCSYFTNQTETINYVRERVKGLGCDVVFSSGRFLDVLPKGINKGSALIRLVEYLGIAGKDVLVAGDTMNDLEMYKCGYSSVVVGNSEKKLSHLTRSMENVFHARHPGAGGILEAMTYFTRFRNFTCPLTDFPVNPGNNAEPQLVMMYHRFPYQEKAIDRDGSSCPQASPNGILPTLQSFFRKRPGLWIAWEEVDASGTILSNRDIGGENISKLTVCPIGLTSTEVEMFYKVFGKEAFWPIIFSFVDKATFNHDHWEHFVKINRIFAERAALESELGAIIWIHDYNLWLVPGFLKRLRPDLRIGFFHHTAFPSANTFNILPWRREIINSLLQCDYIGFHIPRYVENFMDVVKSLFPVRVLEEVNCAPRFLTYSTAMGVEKMTTLIDTGQKRTRLGANPVGVNVDNIIRILGKKSVRDQISGLREQFEGKKIVLSVERLDYVKGSLEKVLAFEKLLNEHPEFHGNLVLINICTPPANGMKIYEQIQHDLEHAVGRINARFSSIDWVPVRLFFRSLPFEEVIAYYHVSDIAWITPLRDGMNLVAKEYVAVQGQKRVPDGVLVLSEFAGAAVELPYVVLTNPYDARSLNQGLLSALQMKEMERVIRMKRLYENIKRYDIHFWADEFLQNLSGAETDCKQRKKTERKNNMFEEGMRIKEFI